MLIKEIKELLDCQAYCSDELLNRDIGSIYAADMMSDVLKACRTGSLLITGLVNLQVIQVAEILDLKAVIIVSGKVPSQDIVNKAGEINLPLLMTGKPMFEACGMLFSHLAEHKILYRSDGTGNTI